MNADQRDALFKAKMLELAIKRGDTREVAKLKYNFKHGGLVQMTRQGIARQNSSGLHPKDESSSGTFIRMRGYLYGVPKYPAAIIQWHHMDRETETRVDYIEPLGTPR